MKKNFVALGFIVTVVFMVLSGCAQQVPPIEPIDEQQEQVPLQNDDSSSPGQDTVIEEPIKTTDGRNGDTIIQETIASVVADGTYVKEITYPYHSGTETLDVTVKVKDDVVTDATIVATPSNPVSKKMIDGVIASLPDLVIGKKITEINLPKNISGSSLTTAAFRQYLDDIVAGNEQHD